MRLYACNFNPGAGHMHTTPEAAQECKESWDKWNNPKPKKNLFNNRPNGGQTPDVNTRSFI